MIEWTCTICGDTSRKQDGNQCFNCEEETEHLYYCSDGETFDDEDEADAYEQTLDDIFLEEED